MTRPDRPDHQDRPEHPESPDRTVPPDRSGPAGAPDPGDDDEATRALTAEESAGLTAPVAEVATRLEPGSSFGPYRILRRLGGGGMGEVYEAESLETGHRLALKILARSVAASAEARARFRREGLNAAAVSHPNSLYVFGTDEIAGVPVIAMELAPGGTVQDRVAAEGPLPPEQTVRLALDLVAGLRAAAERGVVHRDIKPSNCFLDLDGTGKVGDYGLSRRLEEGEGDQLTRVQAFIGTPAYASPEQIRGQELDLRSDVYSLGATLHFALTGQAPHPDRRGTALLAAILEEEPAAPHVLRPSVPVSLSRIVQRCLARDPAARYQDYGELADALARLLRENLRPAAAWPRVVAGVVDSALSGVLEILTLLLVVGDIAGPQDHGAGWLAFPVALLYSSLLEGLWGTTPGKRIHGLRVVDALGRRPGLPRALLRSFIFQLPYMALNAAVILGTMAARQGAGPEAGGAWVQLQTFLSLGIWLLLFTRRPVEGYREGWHERFSGTRVVRDVEELSVPWTPGTTDAPADAATRGRIGPYELLSGPRPAGAGQVVLAFDPRLRRRVWIQVHEGAASPTPAARRECRRRHRPRWLHGGQQDGRAWDAYEHVPGRPLARLRGMAVSWVLVRRWLATLADEIRAAREEGLPLPELTCDRVWIDDRGEALLLDFPVTGAGDGDVGDGAFAPVPEATATETAHARGHDLVFLARVAFALVHGTEPPRRGGELPRLSVPIPLSGLEILRRLRDGEFASLEDLLATLREQAEIPAAVSRRRRVGHLLLSGWLLLGMGLLMTMGVVFVYYAATTRPDQARLEQALDRWRHHAARDSADATAVARLRAIEVLVAGPLQAGMPDSTAEPTRGALDRILLSAEDLALVAEIRNRTPAPGPEEVAAARAELAPERGELEPDMHPLRLIWRVSGLLPEWTSLWLLLVAPWGLLSGFLFRGGWLYRAFGLALAGPDGAPAGRWRCLLRSLLVWLPAVPLFVVLAVAGGVPTVPSGGEPAVQGQRTGEMVGALLDAFPKAVTLPVTLAVVVGLVWAVVRPSRGLPDRLAGTTLVPR